MRQSPRLTVVMPVYNAMPYLRDAVASVLNQSHKDLILQVIDDGSTDDGLTYLYSIGDARLQVLEVKGRNGQGAARNLAIERCETEYLAFADADDISLPNRFEKQIAYLDGHPAIGMLGSHFAYIGSSNQPGLIPPLAQEHDAIRSDLLLGRHAVSNPTLMFRTSVFKQTGAFRINGAGEDVDLFLRMTEHTRVENLSEILCHYRLHASSTNSQQALTLLHRYAHAAECAHLREKHLPETTFEDFRERQAKRSSWVRTLEQMDLHAKMQYRGGVVDLLNGSKIRGYGRFGLAALLSPQRLVQRLTRSIRGSQRRPN
jgi:glycosyltransferase involved in cell wall biosynthesis